MDICSALVFVGIYQFNLQPSTRLVFFHPPDNWCSVSVMFRCRSWDRSSAHPLSPPGVTTSCTFYAGRLSFLPFNTERGDTKQDFHKDPPLTLNTFPIFADRSIRKPFGFCSVLTTHCISLIRKILEETTEYKEHKLKTKKSLVAFYPSQEPWRQISLMTTTRFELHFHAEEMTEISFYLVWMDSNRTCKCQ